MVDVKHIEPNAVIYTTLLDSLYKEGKPDEADELWKEMVDKGCARDVAAYNVRVMHRALHGKLGDVLEKLQELSLIPSHTLASSPAIVMLVRLRMPRQYIGDSGRRVSVQRPHQIGFFWPICVRMGMSTWDRRCLGIA
ncbi:unnamed protein product [Musa acuminata subsp. burmannicoides]